jgi:hypothetical protein
MKKVKAIPVITFPKLAWKPETLEADITLISDYVLEVAGEAKNYYTRNSPGKRVGAKLLRFVAIMAAAFGGVIPIISQIAEKYKIDIDPGWATVAVTVAITAIGLDRFFGYSSGWMRFITCEMKLDSRIQQFRLSMAAERFGWEGKAPSFEQARSALVLPMNFMKEVGDMVQDETNAWMVEFQNVIQKVNEELKVSYEASKTGGINVMVTNAEKFPGGVQLQLEGKEPVRFNGATYSYSNLYPKMYKVSIKGTRVETTEGKKQETSAQAESIAIVKPGEIATITLEPK